MQTFFDQKNATRMGKVILLIGIFGMLFIMMKFLNETKKWDGGNSDITKASTIDVSGEGTAFAVPDIASESFTVEQKSPTVHDAQASVSSKVNAIIAFLKSSGVVEKDIQTTNYSANPEYSYPNPCYGGQVCPANSGAPKLLDYDVSETITIKIRNADSVGKIIDGLGSKGATNMYGPNFTVDDETAVNAQARAKAIADAKEKAEVLARDLGVTLVRIVRFSENNGGGYPMAMYAKDMAAGSAAAPTSALPAGQNKYTSNVTITYEIR